MQNHKVTIRHYNDGAISVHARKDETYDIESITKWAFAQDCQSPVFEYTRLGKLEFVQVAIDELSRSEAESSKKTLIRYYRNMGRKVLNEQ